MMSSCKVVHESRTKSSQFELQQELGVQRSLLVCTAQAGTPCWDDHGTRCNANSLTFFFTGFLFTRLVSCMNCCFAVAIDIGVFGAFVVGLVLAFFQLGISAALRS